VELAGDLEESPVQWDVVTLSFKTSIDKRCILPCPPGLFWIFGDLLFIDLECKDTALENWTKNPRGNTENTIFFLVDGKIHALSTGQSYHQSRLQTSTWGPTKFVRKDKLGS
jgi:hypothetical protein